MKDIVSRLRTALGGDFFVEPTNEPHEMVDVRRKGYLSNHPSKQGLEEVVKETMPGIDFKIEKCEEGFFYGAGLI